MIQCPECRSMIPDDSAFCDQCGKELKWCPECGRPKRGAECPVCGSDLVPGRKWLAGTSAEGGTTPEDRATLGNVRGGTGSEANGGVERSETSEGVVTASALVGNGWRLTLQPGQFGRGGGIWPELGSCPYVSGLHGQISEGPGGCWNITDVGSTNGTFVDGIRIQSGVATPLKKGSKVRIATLDFIVE